MSDDVSLMKDMIRSIHSDINRVELVLKIGSPAPIRSTTPPATTSVGAMGAADFLGGGIPISTPAPVTTADVMGAADFLGGGISFSTPAPAVVLADFEAATEPGGDV